MLRATLFALTMVGVCSIPAHASGLKAIQSVEVATLSIEADGTEIRTYTPASEVEPGEQVRYSLSFVNEGTDPAEKVSLVMPIPAEVTYVEGSISGVMSEVSFSVDAGQTFVPRTALRVEDGETMRAALATDITHIKWDLTNPIAPTESGSVSYEAVLK